MTTWKKIAWPVLIMCIGGIMYLIDKMQGALNQRDVREAAAEQEVRDIEAAIQEAVPDLYSQKQRALAARERIRQGTQEVSTDSILYMFGFLVFCGAGLWSALALIGPSGPPQTRQRPVENY